MEETTVSLTQTTVVLCAIAVLSALFSYFFVAKILISKGVSKTKSIIVGKAVTTLLLLVASFIYLYYTLG